MAINDILFCLCCAKPDPSPSFTPPVMGLASGGWAYLLSYPVRGHLVRTNSVEDRNWTGPAKSTDPSYHHDTSSIRPRMAPIWHPIGACRGRMKPWVAIAGDRTCRSPGTRLFQQVHLWSQQVR